MFFIGTALFGRVDKVAGGLFYVGTVFVHIFFIPLIPMRSFVVRREKDVWYAGFQGVQTRMSIKSVLYGWGRALAVLWMLSGLLSLTGWHMASVLNPLAVLGIAFPALLAGVLGAALYWLLHVTSSASDARAAELAQIAGYSIERAPARAG